MRALLTAAVTLVIGYWIAFHGIGAIYARMAARLP